MKIISHKTSWRVLVGICIIIGVAVFVSAYMAHDVGVSSSRTSLPIVSSTSTRITKEFAEKVHGETRTPVRYFTLIVGSTNIHMPFSPGATLYDALSSAQKNGVLSFSGKEYNGLGYFVTDIDALHQANGKYLVYFINGTEASTGVSSYVVKEGDTIVWKLQ